MCYKMAIFNDIQMYSPEKVIHYRKTYKIKPKAYSFGTCCIFICMCMHVCT